MSASSKPARSTPTQARGSRVRLRPRVWLSLVGLLAAGYGAHVVWHGAVQSVSQHAQYALKPENIHITPPPPWIRSDIKVDVVRSGGLESGLTLLDDGPTFVNRIQNAFELHPLVASVERIRRRLPSCVEVELTYRRPVAAVESSDGNGLAFLPVDGSAVRLPENDLTDVERRYLPRISGIVGRPAVGNVWDDLRVVEGVQLAAALADVWQQLRLVEIMADEVQPAAHGEQTRYAYNIITSGGTRICWGAPPGRETAAGESTFDEKRARLLQYSTEHGQLDTIDGPETLDLRVDTVVTQRTARRETSGGDEPVPQTK